MPSPRAVHLITVTALALAIAALCIAGRALRSPVALRRYEQSLAIGTGLLWIGYQVFDGVTTGWDVRHSLPLQLCDLAALFACLTFARPQRSLHAIAYFWGLALSTQALITPDLTGGPSTLEFWAFWLYHLFVVGAGVYVVAVRRFRPAARDLRFAIAAGIAYAVIVFAIDATFDLNYGYLGRTLPGRPTLLDVLGPWPMRTIYMVALGAAAMTLLWLPWQFAPRKAPAPNG